MLLFSWLVIAEKQQNVSAKSEVTYHAADIDTEPLQVDVSESHLPIDVDNDSSDSNDPEECWVYDDDILQRKLELRESKISDLLLKREGLLQTIEKMAAKNLPSDELKSCWFLDTSPSVLFLTLSKNRCKRWLLFWSLQVGKQV